MRWLAIITTVCVLSGAGVGSAYAQTSDAKAETALAELRALMELPDCDFAAFRKFVAGRSFKNLSGRLRSATYAMGSVCAEEAEAFVWLDKATAEPGATAFAWTAKFNRAGQAGRTAEALSAIETAARLGPADDVQPWGETVVELWSALADDQPARWRLMVALDAADWKPSRNGAYVDHLWADYAVMSLAAGDRTAAQRAAGRIRDPLMMLQVRLDPAYASLLAAEPASFTLPGAARAAVEADAAAEKAGPDKPVDRFLIPNLRLLGRLQEALDLADSRIARTRGGEDDHRNWLYNDRASTLFDMGRIDQAIVAMSFAASLPEDGAENVSQRANLAILLNRAGRPDEALAALDALARLDGDRAPAAFIAAERACALAALGRTTEARKGMAAPGLVFTGEPWVKSRALLCLGDLDALAAHLIFRLSDPSQRATALVELCRFEGDPLTEHDKEMARRLETVRQRPDILTAVKAAGRTEKAPFRGGVWFDFY